ncbi:unnamed protein product [Periconia digitata]|uniref:Homeobox domain-containing protein n=1 Tax=Periconia digitata TaxID=1303443 RepID=A0A9W4UCJ9_9PLEO|nr:unnamed protein product [Periconia digitata]
MLHLFRCSYTHRSRWIEYVLHDARGHGTWIQTFLNTMPSPNDLSPNGKAPSVWSLDSGYASMAEDNSVFQSVHPTASPASNRFQSQPQSRKPAVGLGLEGLDDANWFRYGSVIEPVTTDHSLFANQISNMTSNAPGMDENLGAEQSLSATSNGDNTSRSKAWLPKLDIPLPDQYQQRCSVCQLDTLVDSSGPDTCAHCFANLYHVPVSPSDSQYSVRRSRAGRNSKLPLHALNCLQNWLSANQHNPYPSAETKRALAQECGITEKQVTTWFTNARARHLSPLGASSVSGSDGEEYGESEASNTPIDAMGGFAFIPDGQQPDRYDRTTSVPDTSVFSPTARQRSSRRGKKKDYRRSHSVSAPPAPDYTQLPVAANSSEALYSFESGLGVTTHSSNATSYSPMADTLSNDPASKSESWQCTFCRKHLVPKSWRRHEETQHRPKAQWTCMLRGPRLLFPSPQSDTTATKCAFCMMVDPPEEHFMQHHRIEECAKRDTSDRTFFRPDHLRQHVKNFHGTGLFDIVQARWKSAAEAGTEGWTCGFCSDKLETWDKRETHIANHFKDGLKMDSWKDFSNVDDKNSKKGKGKRKERAQSQVAGMGRLGQPFASHSERNSYVLDTAAPIQQQRPQPQTYSQIHQQQYYQGDFAQPQRPSSPLHQANIANAYQSVPYSSSFPLPQPQQPIVPTSAPLDTLMLDCTNPFEWGGITTSATAAPMPMQPTTQQPPYQHLNYPLAPPTGGFNTANMDPATAAAFQQQFEESLQNMGLSGVDIYGNPLNYQGGPWEGQ